MNSLPTPSSLSAQMMPLKLSIAILQNASSVCRISSFMESNGVSDDAIPSNVKLITGIRIREKVEIRMFLITFFLLQCNPEYKNADEHGFGGFSRIALSIPLLLKKAAC